MNVPQGPFDVEPILRQLRKLTKYQRYGIITLVLEGDAQYHFSPCHLDYEILRYAENFPLREGESPLYLRLSSKVMANGVRGIPFFEEYEHRLSDKVWLYEFDARREDGDFRLFLLKVDITSYAVKESMQIICFCKMFSSALVLVWSEEAKEGILANLLNEAGCSDHPRFPILPPIQVFLVKTIIGLLGPNNTKALQSVKSQIILDKALNVHGPYVCGVTQMGKVLTSRLYDASDGEITRPIIEQRGTIFSGFFLEEFVSTFVTYNLSYTVEQFSEFLGNGAFGFVFKVDADVRNKVAVKIIDSKRVEEETELTREVRYMMGKTHKYIVQTTRYVKNCFSLQELRQIEMSFSKDMSQMARNVFQFWTSRATAEQGFPTFCITMQLCGKSLRQWILSEEEKLRKRVSRCPTDVYHIQRHVLFGMICGVQFLHSKGVVHRDIRPENVLFSQENLNEYALPIKLGDFGLCRKMLKTEEDSYTTKTSLTVGAGNYNYQAPEVNTKNYDHLVDYFSLGLTIWEALLLFPSVKRNDLFYRLKEEDDSSAVDEHPTIPIAKPLITAMVQRNKSQRDASVRSTVPTDAFRNVEDYGIIHIRSEKDSAFWVELGADKRELLWPAGDFGELSVHTDKIRVSGDFRLNTEFTKISVEGSTCNVTFVHTKAIEVNGNKDCVQQIKVSGEGERPVITIRGCDNIVQDILCVTDSDTDIARIVIAGERNMVQRFKWNDSSNTRFEVSGTSCELRDFEIRRPANSSASQDIDQYYESPFQLVHALKNNQLCSSVHCSERSVRCLMKAITIPTAIIEGEGHVLEDVTSTAAIACFGRSVVMRNCESPILYVGCSTVQLDDCRFGQIVETGPHFIRMAELLAHKIKVISATGLETYHTTLQECIDACMDGDSITLPPNSEHFGSFVIRRDNIKLFGSFATLTGKVGTFVLDIAGDGCKVENLTVVGEGSCIYIIGDENYLQGIAAQSNSNEGVVMHLQGSDNTVVSCTTLGGSMGLCISGERNSARSIQITKPTGAALSLVGPKTRVTDIELRSLFSFWPIQARGWVGKGLSNFSNLKIDHKRWHLNVNNAVIEESVLLGLCVIPEGKKISFYCVTFDKLDIQKDAKVKMTNCTGSHIAIDERSEVEEISCNFACRGTLDFPFSEAKKEERIEI